MATRTLLRTVLRASCFRSFSTVAGRPLRGGSYDIPSSITKTTSLEVLYKNHGDPLFVLTDKCEPLRPLQHKEILVKMLVAPVNPVDIQIIQGCYFDCPRLPCVAGNEGVGEVIDIGCGVEVLRQGDWVVPADFGFGTWRTMCIVEEDDVIKVPNDLPAWGAATVSLPGCTAYRILKGVVHLSPCDLIMQDAANSAVGQAIVQLCSRWGIHTINVIRDRPDTSEVVQHLRALGATHVITDKFLESKHMCHFIQALKKRPRLVIDCVGGRIAREMARHMEKGAVIATYGQLSENPEEFHECGFDIRPVKVYGFWRSMWCCEHNSGLSMESVLLDLCEHMRSGLYYPPPVEAFNLVKYKDAVKYTLEECRKGKAILKLDDRVEVPKCQYLS